MLARLGVLFWASILIAGFLLYIVTDAGRAPDLQAILVAGAIVLLGWYVFSGKSI
jgi:hypothetical protein